jgi:chromate reductase, NAD(P)H dehydrogenase (quinone)
MGKKYKVIGIAGSLRKASTNKGLLRAAAAVLPDDLELEVVDISNFPHYNGDVDDSGPPEIVKQVSEKIKNADGLLISTPEYNYSIPGFLKNAIDWISRSPLKPFDEKPLAIMGSTMGAVGGTVRSQTHLRNVAVFTNMIPMNKPEILITSSGTKFDAEGNLTDEKTLELLEIFLESFSHWIGKVGGKQIY